MITKFSFYPPRALNNAFLTRWHYSQVFMLLAAAVLVSGCFGRGVVPVSGKLLSGGVVPASGLQITFEPLTQQGDERALAGVQLDGTFTMYTLPKKGVKPGEYLITVSITPLSGATRPDKFANIKTTPWKVTVPNGGIKNLILDLEKDEVVVE